MSIVVVAVVVVVVVVIACNIFHSAQSPAESATETRMVYVVFRRVLPWILWKEL